MDLFDSFIRAHSDEDTATLLLSRQDWPENAIGADRRETAVSTIECYRRLRTKAPEWCSTPGLIFPDTLCAEQCSSSATARFKAGLAAGLGVTSVADLTGGLGLDSAAFSEKMERVLYNEMKPALAAAAEHNFLKLGISNIEVRCGDAALCLDRLHEFDMVFMDPARRASDGRKVFFLEDCQPDILQLKDRILEQCKYLCVKLSPMADISLLSRQLGSCLKEVHCLGHGGECKELLLLMQSGWNGGVQITVTECGSGKAFSFRQGEESGCVPALPSGAGDIAAGRLLFEPGKALMKSGAYNLLCSRFGLVKIGRSTHLYLADQRSAGELEGLGKLFSIKEVMPLDKSSIKAAGKAFPKCEVTARNIPMTSEELRKKMGAASGDSAHIFGVTADFTNGKSGRYLIICDPSSI